MADRINVLIYHFSLVSMRSKLGYFLPNLEAAIAVCVGVHGVGLNWVL